MFKDLVYIANYYYIPYEVNKVFDMPWFSLVIPSSAATITVFNPSWNPTRPWYTEYGGSTLLEGIEYYFKYIPKFDLFRYKEVHV